MRGEFDFARCVIALPGFALREQVDDAAGAHRNGVMLENAVRRLDRRDPACIDEQIDGVVQGGAP
jgi:hypothetical protein